MHKVVSNTTPIISLLKLSLLDILKQLYTKVIIPNAVYQEIEAEKIKHTIKIYPKSIG
jgi:predicted nucleic acid-binding protein